ncbi:MAG: hypothetical protein WEA76_02600 [Acidimicrobiia bacterium]
MSITVPTAEEQSPVRGRHLTPLVPVAALLLAVVATWPSLAFSESPVRVPPPPDAAPAVEPPLSASPRVWDEPIEIDPSHRLVGFGQSVVSVTGTGLWPASILRDGVWRPLLGLPLSIEIAPGVGAVVDDGFLIVGVTGDRTVMFEFDVAGRFGGAHTVFGVRAGVVAAHQGDVVVFDVDRPLAVVSGPDSRRIQLPGVVTDAASTDEGLVVLDNAGAIHVTSDGGVNWRPLGTGYAGLVEAGGVYAVGASVSKGIHEYRGDDGLVRLEGAPIGPTVSWGGRLAVYDWSADSAWVASASGWERLALWKSGGFGGTPTGFLDGTSLPTVVGVDADGRFVMWQALG